MIWNHLGKELASIMLNGHLVDSLYRGGRLVWQAVRSCFGSGIWIGRKPWIGKEKWKSHR